MNHADAKLSNAAERYVLKELPDAESEGFEEHFFDCPECALDVRHLALMSEAIRECPIHASAGRPVAARGSNWLDGVREWWSRPIVGLAAAAAILWLTVLSAYQARELRQQFKPQATVSFLLLPDARGTVTTVSSHDASQVVVLEADLPGSIGGIKWEVRRIGANEPIGEGEAVSPRSGSVLKVILPPSYLAAGEYSLAVRSVVDGGRSWLFHFKVV